MGFFAAGLRLFQKLKYGKQIGKISPNNLACYAKKGKNGFTSYTTVNVLTGEKVLTKNITRNKDYTTATVFDAKGNQIAYYETIKESLGFGHASHNQHAYKVRNVAQKYNKFGQTIDSRDITLIPSTHDTEALIQSSVNGQEYTRHLDTKTNQLSPKFEGIVNLLG